MYPFCVPRFGVPIHVLFARKAAVLLAEAAHLQLFAHKQTHLRALVRAVAETLHLAPRTGQERAVGVALAPAALLLEELLEQRLLQALAAARVQTRVALLLEGHEAGTGNKRAPHRGSTECKVT